MARPCTVCAHEEREAIDSCLVGGVPYRTISKRHEGVSPSSLSRHRAHVTAAIIPLGSGTETGTRADGGTLLAQLRGLYSRVEGILSRAEADGRPSTALAAIKEARAILETVARVTGELDERPVTNVINLHTDEEFVAVQRRLLAALAPYPQARIAAAEALAAPEAG